MQSYDGKPGWICNTCRFDKKKLGDWVIEGPTKIARHSVIGANHYIAAKRPHETIANVMGGRHPKVLLDIHKVSDVNKPEVLLSELPGPATGDTFDGDTHEYSTNITDGKINNPVNEAGTDSTNPNTP